MVRKNWITVKQELQKLIVETKNSWESEYEMFENLRVSHEKDDPKKVYNQREFKDMQVSLMKKALDDLEKIRRKSFESG